MKQIAATLSAHGVQADAHHMTIKKAYREHTGEDLPAGSLARLRELMANPAAAAPTKALRVPPWTLKKYLSKFPDRTHVVAIEEVSPDHGRPTKLTIECVDCSAHRSISSQDAFQAMRCLPCQEIYMQRRRHERYLARRARLGAKKAGA